MFIEGIIGGSWIDDFTSNRLSEKWVPTRVSLGGQKDGQWIREIKDSKIYWRPTNAGTETSRWGESLYLPINAVGDFSAEVQWRWKKTGIYAAGAYLIGLQVQGVSLNTYISAHSAGFSGDLLILGCGTGLPGFPSMIYLYTGMPYDVTAVLKLVRKNGYLFSYFNNTYTGFRSFPEQLINVILSFTVASGIDYNLSVQEYQVDWVKVWPREVVL